MAARRSDRVWIVRAPADRRHHRHAFGAPLALDADSRTTAAGADSARKGSRFRPLRPPLRRSKRRSDAHSRRRSPEAKGRLSAARPRESRPAMSERTIAQSNGPASGDRIATASFQACGLTRTGRRRRRVSCGGGRSDRAGRRSRCSGNLIYTQEQRGDDEIVACYDLTTGAPVWRHRDAARFWESNAGAGPRGTPTLEQRPGLHLGATGIVNALDARTGAVIWSRNAATDTGAPLPGWGFAGSPLVVRDLVIVATGGRLAAYERATGAAALDGADRRLAATAHRSSRRSTASSRCCW